MNNSQFMSMLRALCSNEQSLRKLLLRATCVAHYLIAKHLQTTFSLNSAMSHLRC